MTNGNPAVATVRSITAPSPSWIAGVPEFGQRDARLIAASTAATNRSPRPRDVLLVPVPGVDEIDLRERVQLEREADADGARSGAR
jgi:hypothetical protein